MMAVNIDDKIPNDNVTAKPLIGPVPKLNKTNAAIKVVILASAIVENAFSYPEWILAWRITVPDLFTNTFKDQHVCINRHTNRQDNPGNAW